MSRTYIRQILDEVNAVTEQCGPILLYGENIDTGSRISGLARGLSVNPAGRILNVGNCELTHIGLGLGMMLDGGRSVLFMKQLDFLLLGLDQMVNTFNVIRSCPAPLALGSFTVILIVCDQGYQGPQSSLNAASDFASLANIGVYCLNGGADAALVVRDQFVAAGFRIICVSQRLFGAPALDEHATSCAADHSVFQYRSGEDLTIACYNFVLRDGVALAARLVASGIESDVFHINYVPGMSFQVLIESCARTGRLVLLDDSKSVTKFGDMLVTELKIRGVDADVLPIGRRGSSVREYGVMEEPFILDDDVVLSFAGRALG